MWVKKKLWLYHCGYGHIGWSVSYCAVRRRSFPHSSASAERLGNNHCNNFYCPMGRRDQKAFQMIEMDVQRSVACVGLQTLPMSDVQTFIVDIRSDFFRKTPVFRSDFLPEK
jgi:hypothetical protein